MLEEKKGVLTLEMVERAIALWQRRQLEPEPLPLVLMPVALAKQYPSG